MSAAAPERWVLVEWVAHWDVRLLGVVEVGGKPRQDYLTGSHWPDWYVWSSYQAAHKWRAAHPKLQGLEILNLDDVLRKHQEAQARG